MSGAPDLYPFSATILSGAAVSDAVNLNNLHLLTVMPPGAWTAANLAVDGSTDGTNWFQLGDQYGALFAFPVTVGRAIQVPGALGITSWKFIRFRSVSTSDATTGVNQGADRVISGFLKRYS